MKNSKLKLITFNIFKKYFSNANPYFLWNDFQDNPTKNKVEDIEENFDLEDQEQMFKNWFLTGDFDEEDEDENEKNVLSDILKVPEVVQVFKDHKNVAINFLKSNYSNHELVIINSKLSLEQKVEKTLAFSKEKNKIIVNPVFQWKNIISRPFAYFTSEHKLINLKLSSSTKREDFFRAFFDIEIIEKILDFQILDYAQLIFKIKQNTKARVIEFEEIASAHASKSSKSTKRSNYSRNYSEYVEQKRKNSYGIETDKKKTHIILEDFSNYEFKSKIGYCSIFEVYHEINDGQSASYPEIGHDQIVTKNTLVNHPFRNEIKNFLYPEFKDSSMKFFKIGDEKFDYKKALETLNELRKIDWKIPNYSGFVNLLQNYRQKEIEYIWYDFESINFPLPVVDYALYYQHIPFQVSIIKTKDSKIIFSEDHVIDPKQISIEDLEEIVYKIYGSSEFNLENKNKYVVYNKSFENKALWLIADLVQSKTKNIRHKLIDMVEQIIANTLDLLDFFSSMNKDYSVIIGSLEGKYSIKLLEKYINKNNFNLKHKIKPYKELEIQNGLLAMTEGIKRFLGQSHDQSWKKIEENLKQYCHNDVMAMLMVYEFIEYIAEIEQKRLEKS